MGAFAQTVFFFIGCLFHVGLQSTQSTCTVSVLLVAATLVLLPNKAVAECDAVNSNIQYKAGDAHVDRCHVVPVGQSAAWATTVQLSNHDHDDWELYVADGDNCYSWPWKSGFSSVASKRGTTERLTMEQTGYRSEYSCIFAYCRNKASPCNGNWTFHQSPQQENASGASEGGNPCTPNDRAAGCEVSLSELAHVNSSSHKVGGSMEDSHAPTPLDDVKAPDAQGGSVSLRGRDLPSPGDRQ